MQIGANSEYSTIWHDPVSIYQGGSPFVGSREFAELAAVSGARPHYMAAMNTLSLARDSDSVEHQQTRTVLVVEDELMVRMPIAEYLRDCGYNVLEAANASEAIAAADTEGPVSLVFSDIRMPGNMDGVGLAEWFQSHYPSVPVLLTSGYNGGRALTSASTSRSRFIEKPYSQTQVERRIAALLDA
jgi:CheY-like chemotaxis protein